MSQNPFLRNVLAAITSFVLFTAFITLPFAAVPIAAIGLAFGLGQAIVTGGLAVLMAAIIMRPPITIMLSIMFVVPTLILVRQALLSRRDNEKYKFYPAHRLILAALAISALGASLMFLSLAGEPGGLPQVFAETMYNTSEIASMVQRLYKVSTLEEMQVVALLLLVAGFASWPLMLLGNLQMAQAILVRIKRNLRPSPDYDQLELPGSLAFVLAGSLLVGLVLDGWVSALFLVFAAIVLAAYFMLGLAIIHAISRGWNGRNWILAALYFILLTMAWVIIPVSLIGFVDSQFNFRKLPRTPDKPSDKTGPSGKTGPSNNTRDKEKN